jgi:hypothetical protein
MTFLITLFAFSLFAMISMIAVKFVEVKSGRRFSFLRWRYKSDHLVRRGIVRMKEFSAIKRAQGYLLLIKTLRKLIDALLYLRKHLLFKSAKFIDMVKGKGHLNNRGGSVFGTVPTPEPEVTLELPEGIRENTQVETEEK